MATCVKTCPNGGLRLALHNFQNGGRLGRDASLSDMYKSFGVTYCLRLQGRMM